MISMDNGLGNLGSLVNEIAVEATGDSLRKIAGVVDATVVMSTPVDTGRARANWQVGVNHAPEGTFDAFPEDKSKAASGTSEALANGAAAIATAQAGDKVIIANNLPYIVPLNEGHSQQAPAGFVEAAVEAAKSVPL